MSKLYTINCREVGIDCDFEARGATIEEVIEQCAEHGRTQHEMHSFRPDFFSKMRSCIRIVDEAASDASN